MESYGFFNGDTEIRYQYDIDYQNNTRSGHLNIKMIRAMAE